MHLILRDFLDCLTLEDGRLRLKCDSTLAETRFRLSAKRTSLFKSAGASVQSITGSRGLRISGSIAGYTMFRGSVKATGYPLHSPVSPSLPLPASPCAITFQLGSTIHARQTVAYRRGVARRGRARPPTGGGVQVLAKRAAN